MLCALPRPVAPRIRGQRCTQAQCEMAFDDIEEAYFAFLPRNTGAVVDGKLKQALDGLSPSIQERIRRLDTVERTDESGPGSSMYSPLTVTTTGLSIARDSLSTTGPAEPEAPPAGNRLAPILGAVALALVGGIVAYVVFVAGGK